MRAAKDQAANLENRGCVAEDEVDGAVDVAFSVELTKCLGVEGVLVPCYAASVDNGTVGSDVQCHCLFALWSCVVVETDISGNKSIACDCCKINPSKFVFASIVRAHKAWEVLNQSIKSILVL